MNKFIGSTLEFIPEIEKEGYLYVYDREFGGRNRRYYQITESGNEKLAEYRREWEVYSANITALFS